MDEQYSGSYVAEILDEVKRMLAIAPVPPSLDIKNAIRNMLNLTEGEEQPTTLAPRAADLKHDESVASFGSSLRCEESMSFGSISSKATRAGQKKSDHGVSSIGADHWSVTAQCVVCGLDGVKGTFCKRGYKCERCEGLKSLDRANPQPPYGRNPHSVPSTAFPRKFFFREAGGVSSVATTGSSDSASRSDVKPAPHKVPMVKYQVLQATPVDLSCLERVRVLQTLVHPNIAYCFGSWTDSKRNKCWTLLEQGPTLSEVRNLPALECDVLSREGSLFDDDLLSPVSGRAARAAAAAAASEEEHAAQHLEWTKKVLVSLMQALLALKRCGVPHGDLRPENIIIDSNNVVKVMVYPVPATTVAGEPRPQLPEPFCAPEDASSSSSPYVPSFAADMYTLGVTLSIVAFGVVRQPPPESKRSAAESRLVELIAGLTARSPEARLTLEHAFLNPLLASVRLVNGVPVETMLATIFDKVAEDGSQQPQGGAWFTATHQQSSSSGNGAALMLQKFISECGPKFQVVSTSTSCTLYSVKHDPRRRAASMSSSASPTSPVPT